MKRKRHTREEIIRMLRTAEKAMAGGRTVEETCRVVAVRMATYQRWKGQYAGASRRRRGCRGTASPLCFASTRHFRPRESADGAARGIMQESTMHRVLVIRVASITQGFVTFTLNALRGVALIKDAD
jgi:hypothetical protein